MISEDARGRDANDLVISEGLRSVRNHSALGKSDFIFIDRSRELGGFARHRHRLEDFAKQNDLPASNIIYVSQKRPEPSEQRGQGPKQMFFHHWSVEMSRTYRDLDLTQPPIECDGTVLCMNNKIRPHRLATAAMARVICGDRLNLTWCGANWLYSNSKAHTDFKEKFPSFSNLDIDLPTIRLESTTVDDVVLGLPREASLRSFLHLVCESDMHAASNRFTEKTLKAVVSKRPFLVFGPAGVLKSLRKMGFQTFSDVFDEGYDTNSNPDKRLSAIANTLKDLLNRPPLNVLEDCRAICEHNAQHLRFGLEPWVHADLKAQLKRLLSGQRHDLHPA